MRANIELLLVIRDFSLKELASGWILNGCITEKQLLGSACNKVYEKKAIRRRLFFFYKYVYKVSSVVRDDSTCCGC